MMDKNARIMIVDDMTTVRRAIAKYLSVLGYRSLLEAGDGDEAVKVFQRSGEEGEDVGAIFLDIIMPVMDGKEALRRIRALDRSVPVIILSALADQYVINECRSLGIEDYLLKPINAQSGPERLSAVLGGL